MDERCLFYMIESNCILPTNIFFGKKKDKEYNNVALT